LSKHALRSSIPEESLADDGGLRLPKGRLRQREELLEVTLYLIRPHLDAWFGYCFENLCREALPWLYKKEGVTASFEVGSDWSKTTQIDVVGLRDDGWTDLAECKWGTVRSPGAVEKELEEKVKQYPNPQGATLGRRVFARTGRPGGGAEGVRWFGLEELYG
jgi:hypothetical protein